MLINDTPCWYWAGRVRSDGYGTQGSRLAHRVVYEGLVGPIPPGKELDHTCRNRACVNPEHLEPVAHLVNIQRGATATKTHCKHGHEYTPENTCYQTWQKYTGRLCRTCRNQRARLAKRIRKLNAGPSHPVHPGG